MRKLLPYEYQLIESLGITKEEYLEFVAIQREYKDPKAGTVLDVRNEAGTVAIVLTVVGILFQVGAALLAPKPEIPDISDRRRRNRQQRFAPTFGFNGTQELASYGDPVNLVYTNQNPLGDVRVAGSLVWSAVDNFGSTQFMRLMVVLGAGEIKSIGYSRTAFGQTSLFDLDKQNVFIFESQHLPGTNEGPPPFNAINEKFANKELFPSSLEPTDKKGPAFVIPTGLNKRKGFSQTYTPTTSTSLGVYDAIPINVEVKTRDKDGDRESADIGIELRDVVNFDNHVWRNDTNGNAIFKVNHKIQIFFNNTTGTDDKPRIDADNLRRQALESLDFGSTYMLGSAKFRLRSISEPRTIDRKTEVRADFICVEQGQIPGTPYNRENPETENQSLRRSFVKAKRILGAANEDFDRSNLKLTQIVPGNSYEITSVKNFNFVTLGASTSTVKEVFVADAKATENVSSNTVKNASVLDVVIKSGTINISFKGDQTVKWKPEYVASVSKNFNELNVNFTDAKTPEDRNNVKRTVSYFEEKSKSIHKAGSILYTQSLLEDHLTDKPVLSTSQLKKQINVQIEKLKKLIAKINSSEHFDGNNNKLLQCENDFINGFKTNPSKAVEIEWDGGGPIRVFRWHSSFFNDVENRATGRAESGLFNNKAYTGVKSGNYYYFTFVYIDSSGRWNLFNFNGVQSTNGAEVAFPDDDTLKKRRDNLNKKEKDFFDNKNKNRGLGGKNNVVVLKDSAIEGTAIRSRRNVFNKNTGVTNGDFTQNSVRDSADKKNKTLENIANRIEKLTRKRHEEAIEVIQKDIELLKQLRDEIRTSEEEATGEKTGETDRAGTKAIKKHTAN